MFEQRSRRCGRCCVAGDERRREDVPGAGAVPTIRRRCLRVLPDAPVDEERIDGDDVRSDVGGGDRITGAAQGRVAAGRHSVARAVTEHCVDAVVSALRIANERRVDRDQVMRAAADGILLVVAALPLGEGRRIRAGDALRVLSCWCDGERVAPVCASRIDRRWRNRLVHAAGAGHELAMRDCSLALARGCRLWHCSHKTSACGCTGSYRCYRCDRGD